VPRQAHALVIAFLVASSCGGAAVAPSPTPATSASATTVATATPTPSAAPTSSPTSTPSVTPTPSPSPAPTGPAPTGPAAYCAVADVPTPVAAYADHVRTFLDWTYRLSDTYVPPDLVSATSGGPYIAPRGVETAGAAEILARRGDPSYSTLLSDAPNAAIRVVAYADLAAMRGAAVASGSPLVILSSYRSYGLQVDTFNYWVRVGGYEQALRTSARPGHSEHQLGTAIDFGDGAAAPWEYEDWATTPTGAWLAAHAPEYGFVMSFPKGKTDVTCYAYEPWHYRYVGKALAQSLSESRVTLREYQSSQLR